MQLRITKLKLPLFYAHPRPILCLHKSHNIPLLPPTPPPPPTYKKNYNIIVFNFSRDMSQEKSKTMHMQILFRGGGGWGGVGGLGVGGVKEVYLCKGFVQVENAGP